MKKTSLYILVSIIIIIAIINLILFSNIIKSGNSTKRIKEANNSVADNTNQPKSEEELAAEELEKLRKMTERDRMEHYFAKFIKYIKNKEYTEAYNLLYPEFREKYFKTQEEFREYAKKTYPSSVGFSYNNIERQGSIYVLMITVIDTNKKIEDAKSQRIVVQENDFNDFVLSFQVI